MAVVGLFYKVGHAMPAGNVLDLTLQLLNTVPDKADALSPRGIAHTAALRGGLRAAYTLAPEVVEGFGAIQVFSP